MSFLNRELNGQGDGHESNPVQIKDQDISAEQQAVYFSSGQNNYTSFPSSGNKRLRLDKTSAPGQGDQNPEVVSDDDQAKKKRINDVLDRLTQRLAGSAPK